MPEHIQLQSSLTLSRSGNQFEVLIIQAGKTKPTRGYPHGLELPAAVLQASVPLWENVQSFIDHTIGQHSLRDLCGVLSQAHWDDQDDGMKAVLTAFTLTGTGGPGGVTVSALMKRPGVGE